MGITTILVGFLLSLVLSSLLTRVAIIIGNTAGIVDKPDGFRKTHSRPIPRIGGVAVFFAVITPSVLLLMFFREIPISGLLAEQIKPLLVCFAGAAMAAGLGLLDDIFDINAMLKLGGQIVIASFMYFMGFRIVAVINPFGGGDIFLGVLAFPFTIFWFLACMNVVNLLDGIDGLAAGACGFVGVTLFFLSMHLGNSMGMFLMACFAGAVLGFLFFNFPPAKIFLGDSGSLLLGFFIASLTLLGGIRKADAAVALFIPVVAMGLPLLDTVLAVVRRWFSRQPISSPDKMHIHHRLVDGLGYSRALWVLYGACVFLLGSALLVTFGSNEVVIFVVVMLVLVIFISFRLFSGLKISDILGRFSADGKMNESVSENYAAVYRSVELMRNVTGIGRLWNICEDLFREIGLDKVTLELGREKALVYRSDDQLDCGNKDGTFEIELPVKIANHAPMRIIFVKSLSQNSTPAVNAEMLKILRDGLEKHFDSAASDEVQGAAG